ncbi:MAG: sulfite exporter TauE/SafE family protein [Planctomycetes bacterium]|nr:sulfite exporter TauE/SafE family protein [Planctomycetota bacterium]
MTPWWLVMMGGLLGSSHCLGMCGGFAALVGLRHDTLVRNLRAQLVFSSGRLMSYGTLGAVAGFAGRRLVESLPKMINVPAILCLVAGLFLVREGLLATGLFRRRISGTSTSGCLLGPVFSTILRTPGMRHTFVAGIVTGLLPCGLVYAFLSLAAASGDLVQGLGTMLAFGIGTVPLMVIAGCGAAMVSMNARQRLWQVAAWSVVVTGLLTLGRGAAFVQWKSTPQPVKCPFCVPATKTAQSASAGVHTSHPLSV